jgi:Arm domain-containing DNA-binding protein
MARQERILSARGAMAITKPGRHSDGGGLYLYLSKDSRRSWAYLFAWQGRQCEMGLGSFPSRLRGRVEAVLDFAKARGWRSGENPGGPHTA